MRLAMRKGQEPALPRARSLAVPPLVPTEGGILLPHAHDQDAARIHRQRQRAADVVQRRAHAEALPIDPVLEQHELGTGAICRILVLPNSLLDVRRSVKKHSLRTLRVYEVMPQASGDAECEVGVRFVLAALVPRFWRARTFVVAPGLVLVQMVEDWRCPTAALIFHGTFCCCEPLRNKARLQGVHDGRGQRALLLSVPSRVGTALRSSPPSSTFEPLLQEDDAATKGQPHEVSIEGSAWRLNSTFKGGGHGEVGMREVVSIHGVHQVLHRLNEIPPRGPTGGTTSILRLVAGVDVFHHIEATWP
mmetsp:Transcript_9579/g.33961  ORF Transcript_9579/g.33961 Transcript_9579/m.33961 type:complete len:305 (+) Transcript_9579:1297-2211(+)